MSVLSDLLQQLVDSFKFDGDDLKVTSTGGGLTEPVSVDDNGGSLTVDGTVSVSNFPGTQPVSGTVSVGNFPATQPISAASLPLPASASQEHVTAASPHASRLSDGTAFYKATTPADTQPVSGTFFQATQPISGTVAVSNFPGTQPVSGTVAVSGTVLVDGSASTQPVSGTITANAGTNLNTSTLSLEATQALVKAKTDNLDVLLSTRLKPADTLAAVTAITNVVHVDDNAGSLTVDGTVAVSNFPASSPSAGDVAHDAVDSGNPVKIGGQARSTNPTPVADADRVNAMYDPLGRLVVVPGHVRDLVVQNNIVLTGSSETTLLAAGAAGVFHDITALILSNQGSTIVRCDLRDATAGTVRVGIVIPGNATIIVPIPSPIKQTTAANNWTADLSTNPSTQVDIFIQAVKNL